MKQFSVKIINPDSKKEINFNNNSEYKFFKDIPDLFLEDESSLTNIQSDFYNDVKFPNYDDLDRPTVMRTKDEEIRAAENESASHITDEENTQIQTDILDIPAFLRRQAD